MWANVSGNEYGLFYGVFSDPPFTGMVAHGPNYYQSINTWYFWISICLVGCLTTKFLRESIILRGTCVLLLLFVLISTWEMLQYKRHVSDIARGSFYHSYPWLESSIYWDWSLLFATVVLLVIEVWALRLLSARIGESLVDIDPGNG